MNTTFFITISIIAIIVISLISIYNGLIRRRNEVENAFGGMDAQLKKRYDLIPNLISSVKQYVNHERETLNNLTSLRTSALNSGLTMNEKVDIDNKISDGIKRIFLSVENYPDLKASETFVHLQKSLVEIESQISAARRTFNAVVTDYNNGIQEFPNSILANKMNMAKKAVFEIPKVERENFDIDKMF